MPQNAALKHLAMIGSQHQPGIVELAARFELGVQAGKFGIHIKDKFIVPAMALDQATFGNPLIEGVQRFFARLNPVIQEGVNEFMAREIGIVWRQKVEIAQKGLRQCTDKLLCPIEALFECKKI